METMNLEAGASKDPFDEGCPTRQILDRVADKWTALVINSLQNSGTMRFSQLRAAIDGISQKMLTQTLRDLERDGLVTRTVYAVVPPRVDYELTPLGKTLRATLCPLVKWAGEHMNEVLAAQRKYDAAQATSESVA